MKSSTRTRRAPQSNVSSTKTVKLVPSKPQSTLRPSGKKPSAEDELTERLDRLSIKATAKKDLHPESGGTPDIRTQTMRKVNNASQVLSRCIASTEKGPRAPKGKGSVSDALRPAKEALLGLNWLRSHRTDGSSLEVERAAVSILSKLVTLELYDLALDACRSIHPSLCALRSIDPTDILLEPALRFLIIPQPSTSTPEPVLDSMTLTYLLHALISFVSGNSSSFAQLVECLTPFSLLDWVNSVKQGASCEPKFISQILIRAYTTLLRTSTSTAQKPSSDPKVTFLIRMRALQCLVSVPPDGSESDRADLRGKVWEQAVHFGSSYTGTMQPRDSGMKLALRVVNQEYAQLLTLTSEAGEGQCWDTFLRCWGDVARKAGDVPNVRRITALQNSSSHARPCDENDALKLHTEHLCTQFCESLSEAETALSSEDLGDSSVLVSVSEQLRQIAEIRNEDNALFREGDDAPPWERHTRRCFERLRRSSIKKSPPSRTTLDLTEACASVLLVKLSWCPSNMTLSSLLDTYFSLAKNTFLPRSVHSWNAAFQWLRKAASLLGIAIDPSDPDPQMDLDASIDKAAFALVLTATLHNLSSKLYNESEFAGAIKFLQGGCIAARISLQWRNSGSEPPEAQDSGWHQLKSQLWRRWELLATCFSRIGDRRAAHGAFQNALSDFPREGDPSQLRDLVERVTKIGNDLRLPGPDACVSIGKDRFRAGQLLRIQLHFLLRPTSRYRSWTRSVLPSIFTQALDCFALETFPIHRATLLLSLSEWSYYSDSLSGTPHEEALAILNTCGPSHTDMTDFAGSIAEYKALAGCWSILHLHVVQAARFDPSVAQKVRELAEGIICTLNARLSKPPTASPGQKTSPRPKAAARRVVRTTRINNANPPSAPRKARVRAAVPKDPELPKKSPRRKALGQLPLNSPEAPNKRVIPEAKRPVDFVPVYWEDVDKVIGLLHQVACILREYGYLSQMLEILAVVTHICEKTWGVTNDAMVRSLVHWARECVQIGAFDTAEGIYSDVGQRMDSAALDQSTVTLFWLSYADLMTRRCDVLKSSSMYCEALKHYLRMPSDNRQLEMHQRIVLRSERLEIAAFACQVFARVQVLQDDVTSAINASLQSLRLWNRAATNLARLSPQPGDMKTRDDDPFSDATPSDNSNAPESKHPQSRNLGGVQWRVSLGLMDCLAFIARQYFRRGSPREAQHFVDQQLVLAETLGSPVNACIALTTRAQIALQQGLLSVCEESLKSSLKYAAIEANARPRAGLHTIQMMQVYGRFRIANGQGEAAKEEYGNALQLLENLNAELTPVLSKNFCQGSTAPSLLTKTRAAVLRELIWLLRDEENEESVAIFNQFLALPSSGTVKTESDTLLARLTLHNVYSLCRSDMVLNSIAESTISLPMGTSSPIDPPATIQQITSTLESAEKLFCQNLVALFPSGAVPSTRITAMSLALITALRTSMGAADINDPYIAANLLDRSMSITFRRELLEAIPQKYVGVPTDDLEWPQLTPNGTLLADTAKSTIALSSQLGDEDEERTLETYWQQFRHKYQAAPVDPLIISSTLTETFPSNWTVVHIAIAEDKNTLFISRQRGGDPQSPLLFCVPLRGRRDEEEEEEQLTFEDALAEFKDIVRLSDDTAKAAKDIARDDKEARTNWWSTRIALDIRLRELLDNIEFCWLGAFKTILSPRPNVSVAALADLRARFHRVFQINLHWRDKKAKAQASKAHRPTGSQSQNLTDVTLDDSLIECFSTLSPACRDEELEDLVYFILDLYQYHGVPLAISEVDITQVVVDLRSALEDWTTANQVPSHPVAAGVGGSEHTFLVLDRNLQGLPWENIPMLRGRSVSRIPTIDFLVDQVELKGLSPHHERSAHLGHYTVNPRNGTCFLNPSCDLVGTQERFARWTQDMTALGWDSLVGKPPTEQQFLKALKEKDLVIYFGHGSGEQYIRSHKIRSLPKCAAVMLWGCSSGYLKDMGEFDRTGTPLHYLIGGCPSLVANLWDVTDRDIDKLTQSVLDKLGLNSTGPEEAPQMTLPAAVAQAREACKLKYLTGAATVVYGLPWRC